MLLQAYQLGVFNIYNTTTSTPIENEEKSVQSTSVAERTDESSVVTTPPQQVTDTEVAEKGRKSCVYCVYFIILYLLCQSSLLLYLDLVNEMFDSFKYCKCNVNHASRSFC